MALPRKLKNMNLFNDGQNYLAVARTVTLPTLARKMESYRGGGMGGPVKVDLGMSDDGIQLEWTLGGFDLTVLRQFGIPRADGVLLRFAGSYQQDDADGAQAVEIVVRGRHEEINPGDAEAGEDTEFSVVTTCSYYKLIVNGVTEIEIDLLNMVEIVNGVDRLAEHRRNIGM
jgi:P2 family phage contractile tail tube protein